MTVMDCDRCRKPLRKVRFEMYSTRAARDQADRMHGNRPADLHTAGYVGTFGGICYYRHRQSRLDTAGGLSFRRVVRVG
jgi:hypothetical protein